MTLRKGRHQLKRGLVDMSATQPPPALDGSPAAEEVLILPTYCPEPGLEAQVVQRVKRADHSGQLQEFAIMLQVRGLRSGLWLDVVRVDCAHGSAPHIHRFHRDGREMKSADTVPPECRELDPALKWATEYVWDIERRIAEWQ